MKTALILDDVADSRAWIAQALTVAFEDVTAANAGTLAEARAWLATHPAPDIALIDLGLPDGSGIELIAQINRQSPNTLCIVASIFDDDEHIFPALRVGAQGYLLKDQPLIQIVELLKGIADGRPPLSPSIARKLLRYFQPAQTQPPGQITEREIEVLRYIAKGMTLPETARLLGISAHTVSGYVKNIYRKLNISSRAEAATVARNLGLV